jgi:hypothetical protein
MKIIHIIILLGAVGAYHYWSDRRSDAWQEQPTVSATDEGGFVDLPVDGGGEDGVLVLAARNCPRQDAQRADALADELSRRGIPVKRTHRVNFTLAGPDAGVSKRINAVMKGRLPIVFVNGRARSNPTIAEIINEYEGGTDQ